MARGRSTPLSRRCTCFGNRKRRTWAGLRRWAAVGRPGDRQWLRDRRFFLPSRPANRSAALPPELGSNRRLANELKAETGTLADWFEHDRRIPTHGPTG